jgi:uncharacterized membrane protein YhaH (DUF805 family)
MNILATETTTTTFWNATAVLITSLIGLAIAIIFVVAYVQIIRRAGYSGWWALVIFVPLLNVVMLFVFAYSEWPIQRELRELRGWANQIQRGSAPGAPDQNWR